MKRQARVERTTAETKIVLQLGIDGAGDFLGSTGVPFLDHMLKLWACHSGCSLSIEAAGDFEVDAHHTVEDIGICFGQSLGEALGDKAGINRYGSVLMPMDEVLVMVALDISGRPYLGYDVPLPVQRVGDFDPDLAEEFFRAVCNHSGLTLHVRLVAGGNGHHVLEAVFKGFALAVKEAVAVTGSRIPSTKGMI